MLSPFFHFFEVVFILDLFEGCPQFFFGGHPPFLFGGRLSSWVKIRLYTKNQLSSWSGSCLKVKVGGGGVVDQLISLSTPTRVEVELGLGCGWAVTVIEKYHIEN